MHARVNHCRLALRALVTALPVLTLSHLTRPRDWPVELYVRLGASRSDAAQGEAQVGALARSFGTCARSGSGSHVRCAMYRSGLPISRTRMREARRLRRAAHDTIPPMRAARASSNLADLTVYGRLVRLDDAHGKEVCRGLVGL